MAVRLKCPSCYKALSFPDDYMGHKQKCPGCGKKFTVPDPEKNKFGRVKCTCGEAVEAWDVFLVDGITCPSCGNVLRRGPAAKPAPSPAPAPPPPAPEPEKEEEPPTDMKPAPSEDYEDEPEDGEEYEEEEEYVDSKTARKRAEKSRKTKRMIYIALSLIICGACVVFLIFIFGYVSKQQGIEKEINSRKDYKYIPPDQDINSPEYLKRKIDPNNPADRFEESLRLANEARKQENWQECIKLAKQALEIRPGDKLATALLTTAEVALDPWKIADLVNTIKDFKKPVRALAYTYDSRLLAAAGDEGIILIFDGDSGRQLYDLQGHTDSIQALAFSPDGKFLASAGMDDVIRIWEVATQKMVTAITQHEDSVHALAFSPDGKQLASASRDKTVRLWKTDGWTQEFKLEHTDPVSAVVYKKDGSYLASGGLDGAISVWNPANGEKRNSISIGEKVYCLAFTPSGEQIIAGTFTKPLTVYDSATGEVYEDMKKMKGFAGWANAICFSPDGAIFAAGCGDGLVRLWKSNLGAIFRTCEGHKKEVTALVFRPDGKMLVSASFDKTINMWVPSGYKAGK